MFALSSCGAAGRSMMGRGGKFGCAIARKLRKTGSAGAPNPLHKPRLPSICPNHNLGFGSISAEFGLDRIATASRIMIVTALAVSLCACSASRSHRPSDDETQHLSPRIIKVGDPVPKGGGVFKLGDPYLAGGRWYVPINDRAYDRVGLASWYGDYFHGRLTANGEVYDMNALTGAHPTLPLPTYVAVTNLPNNRTVVVRSNDRGPYHDDRIIDLSHKAAEVLGFYGRGTAQVRVRYLGPAPLNGDDTYERAVLAQQPWAPRVISNAARPPSPAQSNMLAAAVTTAEWRVVVKKGSFEGRRNAEGSQWLTASEPTLTSQALYMNGR